MQGPARPASYSLAFLSGGSSQLAAGFLGTTIPLLIGLGPGGSDLLGHVTASYSAGFALGCLTAPALIGLLGSRTAFVFCMVVQATCSLLLALVPQESWTVLRAAMGFCGAGSVVVFESWINTTAASGWRTRIFSLFNFWGRLAMMGGQALAATGWAQSAGATALPAALYLSACAALVILLGKDMRPAPRSGIAMLRAMKGVPLMSAVAITYVGAVGSTLVFMAPGWGIIAGLAPATAALLAVTVQSGSFLFQWPLAWLADNRSRQGVILAAMAVTFIAATILLLGGIASVAAIFALCAVMGGCTLPVYAIAHSSAFERAGSEAPVALSGALLLCWAAGGFLGPILAGVCMERFGPGGLFMGIGAVTLTCAGLILVLNRAR
ncbi:MFS transporter [Halodurantibacterium flavum]